MVTAQFVEVPPATPRKNSFVFPAYGVASNKELLDVLFVPTKRNSSVNRFVLFAAKTSASALASPFTVKSNAINFASAGTQ
ncbi:MAG: hypothetical protein EXS31_18905 [Pedosphaera sp.]|nr:hypothetical protein [Pedosphaera sp.]